MSDLRKAVSDEATKLSDTTRQLATAVAGALFGGIALIVARLTVPTPGAPLSVAIALIGIVLALYVAAMIVTGWTFMKLQGDLRSEWRSRLYRFVPESDYQALVETPAKSAEDGFKTAAWISIVMTGLLFVAFFVVAFFV